MKSLKFARYQMIDAIIPVKIYYMIFISVIALITTLAKIFNGSLTSSGIEFSTVIFIFIVGLNSFKSNFKFSQANNISRKSFVKGLIIAVFPVTAAMSVIDLVLNRIYNIFVPCPTSYDMIYGPYRGVRMYNELGEIIAINTNQFLNICGTIIWQFTVYSVFFIIGIFISALYYRSNKILKVVISAIPFILLVVLTSSSGFIPDSIWDGVSRFIVNALGLESNNPMMAVFSFGVLAAVFSGFIYLLTAKAVAKD